MVGVNLDSANLDGAVLDGADLTGASLNNTNLINSKGLTIRQLVKVKSMFGAKLDKDLTDYMTKRYPHLFVKS